MQTLIEYGIALIVSLQGAGDWLVVPMRFFSSLGTENFFFLVLPLIYWCIDSSLGLRVGLILVTSDMINTIGKLVFAGPRPYWVSSQVKGLWPEASFGIPSGHAQNAISVWGMIAVKVKKTWVWIAAACLTFLIGFSRIFLGAHFPHDVLAGWLIGGLLLFLFASYGDSAAAWFANRNIAQQILTTFLISLIFIVIGFSVATMRQGFQIPAQWMSNAILVGPQPVPVDPNSILSSAGTLFGLAAGAAWMMQSGGYQVSGPFWKRVARYLLGFLGVVVFWRGLGYIFPHGDGFISLSMRYVRYALVGGWVACGAPWVFQRMKL